MGVGTIKNNIGDGKYSVELNYDTSLLDNQIANDTAIVATISADIDNLDPLSSTYDADLKTLTARKTRYEDLIKKLEALIPDDPIVDAWCADLSDELSGEVSTIEIPGEKTFVNVAPGYVDGVYYGAPVDVAKYGQLTPVMAMSPSATFYNLAMLPGWQKWKPTYRYGQITAIDGDLCDVSLEGIESSQQNLDVNQSNTLSDVSISYMT